MMVQFDWELHSRWQDDGSETGKIHLSLRATDQKLLPEYFKLAYTAITRIPHGTCLENAEFVRRVANYHELKPLFGNRKTRSWDCVIPQLSHKPNHVTDGPKSAFLILPDGSTQYVTCAPFQSENDKGPGVKKDVVISQQVSAEPLLGLVPMAHDICIEEWAHNIPETFHLENEKLCYKLNGLLQRLSLDPAPVFDANGGDIRVLVSQDKKLASEAYRLQISPQSIIVNHGDEAGCFYGLIAIAQMLLASKCTTENFAFPDRAIVADKPVHSWRGMHLDVSRQVYTRQAVLDFLDILAWHKLNRFHWHLTDDEGWRLQSLAYPRLTGIGAFRGHGLSLLPQHGSGAEPYGGFFSINDVKAILAHARELHIEIIPEIDVPGHCHAALMAIPELLDPGAMAGGASVQGYVNNALNPGLMATWTFLETIFGEVADLFPGPFVHIGGDEVAHGAWDGSRAAMSWARAKGLVKADGTADAMKMQAAILRFVQARLTDAGKITLGWEEASKGGGLDPDKTILMAWMNAQSGPELAALGYQVIMAPGEAYYLDMAQSEDWQEPGLSWAGTSGPAQTYHFDPLAGFKESRNKIIGLQGCIWSENLVSRSLFNHMVFPRLSAIAENAWRPGDQKSWDSFAARLKLMPQALKG